MVRHAAPIFREQRSGVIINTGSESGLGHFGQANYSAAKEGIIGFTRTVARDLGRFNIRCNAIRPRAMDTRLAGGEGGGEEAGQEARAVLWHKNVIGNRGFTARAGPTPKRLPRWSAGCAPTRWPRSTGRTFQIGGGEVGLWSEPELVRASFRERGWDIDSLDQPALREYLLGD